MKEEKHDLGSTHYYKLVVDFHFYQGKKTGKKAFNTNLK